MTQSVTRTFWELLKAVPDYMLAKSRSITNPCPPHEYEKDWAFCVKCGQYTDERRNQLDKRETTA